MFSPISQHRYWRPAIRAISLLCFCVFIFLLLHNAAVAQNNKDTLTLEMGKPTERELAGGQSHSYRILLAAGQFVYIVVDQRGIDVVVTAFGPDGKEICEVDSPNGAVGPEPVGLVAAASGSYRVEIRSLEKEARPGGYEIKVSELRVAVEQDKYRIAVDQLFREAEILRGEETAESFRKAIKKYEEAIPLYQITKNLPGEGLCLINIGLIHSLLGEKRRAIGYYEQAVPILKSAGDSRDEATAITNIGTAYYALGEKQKALDYLAQAIPLRRSVGDLSGEGATINNIGAVYFSLGDKEKALENYERALLLYRTASDRRGEGTTLSNIGLVYDSMGEKQKALKYYSDALPIRRVEGDRNGEATTLNNIGGVYDSLGDHRKALEYYSQALSLHRAIGDKASVGITITNIGSAYNFLGEKQKALNFFFEALPIFRGINDPNGEAAALNNIGAVYNSIGDGKKALDYFEKALPLRRSVGDRVGEARTLQNTGEAYSLLSDQKKAIDYYFRTLLLSRATKDRLGEASTLVDLARSYQLLTNPTCAVFYGKQSITIYQDLRFNIHSLDTEVQKAFLKSVERSYRMLAELLIAQNRIIEAHQVLNAFKDERFFDFEAATSTPTVLALTGREKEFRRRYETVSDKVAATGTKLTDFKQQVAGRQPTRDDEAQLGTLEENWQNASNEFKGLFEAIESDLSKSADVVDGASDVKDVVEMHDVLRQVTQETGQKAVAVYTFIGEKRFYVLVITPTTILSDFTQISGIEFDQKARQLSALLRSPDYDPTGLANELYRIVFERIGKKLPNDVKTIIWSLDGNLRYIPIGALYDGKQYLAERYNHVVFTRADKERLIRSVKATWTGYGFSSSAPHTVEVAGTSVVFNSLESAEGEMHVFRTPKYTHGIIVGDVFADSQFTKASLVSNLKNPRPVVHISSHFRFSPGDMTKSFLLLGDGDFMTLAQIKEQPNLFHGVELLTLSGCDTAAQQADATGKEIDAFAELAQRLGADAVLATLWAVRENSTAQLMNAFYNYRQGGKHTKAEALRLAQLDLLRGKTIEGNKTPMIATAKSGSNEGLLIVDPKYRIPFKREKDRPFAHPYYWSPFVLFGNWK